jgi:ribonuclease HII
MDRVAKYIEPSLLGVLDKAGPFPGDAGNGGFFFVAGVDEAGRGALAGPVVAAAVVLPDGVDIPDLADSKSLTALQRTELCSIILEQAAAVGLGIASAGVVDEKNVLNAALTAMARAVERMEVIPQHVLVDGNKKIPMPVPQTPVVGGDAKIAAISAASIVAKVHRDAMMERLAGAYPRYGFDRHKGYATAGHKEALERYGPTAHHRFTFRPVRESMNVLSG